jgi:exonuclease III
MRIAPWNVNSLRVRLPQVLEWLARTPGDVPGMQETKLSDPDFPHAQFAGQKTYNDVGVLSRVPGTAVLTGVPAFEDPARRVLIWCSPARHARRAAAAVISTPSPAAPSVAEFELPREDLSG